MYRLKDLIKYRSVWMGMAIIWVVFYHIGIAVSNPIIRAIKDVGYGGVDIFVFCTGLGCYYSLEKNSDTVDFYIRRIKRIYPTYWIFLPIWFAYKAWIGEFKPAYFVGNILGFQTYTGNWNEVNWYISAIVLYYFICPLFYALVKRFGNDKKRTLVILALIFAVTMAFWNSLHLNIITTRFPLLFMGMLLGKMCFEEVELTGKMKATVVGAIFVGIALLAFFSNQFVERYRPWGLGWYPFIFIVPGTCLVISMISILLEKNALSKHIVSAVSWVGHSSFEIYLTHFLLFEILKYCIDSEIISDNWVIWVVALILAVILAVLLKWLTTKAKKLINL